jgi:hypothetical protein
MCSSCKSNFFSGWEAVRGDKGVVYTTPPDDWLHSGVSIPQEKVTNAVRTDIEKLVAKGKPLDYALRKHLPGYATWSTEKRKKEREKMRSSLSQRKLRRAQKTKSSSSVPDPSVPVQPKRRAMK